MKSIVFFLFVISFLVGCSKEVNESYLIGVWKSEEIQTINTEKLFFRSDIELDDLVIEFFENESFQTFGDNPQAGNYYFTDNNLIIIPQGYEPQWQWDVRKLTKTNLEITVLELNMDIEERRVFYKQ